MTSPVALKKIAEMANSGKKYPAIRLIGSNPTRAALLSKLVKDPRYRSFKLNDKTTHHDINSIIFNEISSSISEKIKSSENIMQLFPDLELVSQIIISSILSPKDMVGTRVFYKLKENIIPSSVSAQILQEIELDLDAKYNIKTELYDILKDMLFISGSYVKVIIPEASLDQAINPTVGFSMESISRNINEINDNKGIGILGNPDDSKTSISLESNKRQPYNSGLYIENNSSPTERLISSLVEITDNFRYLKLPSLNDKMASIKINKTISLEGSDKLSINEIEALFFKKTDVKEEPVVVLNTANQAYRKSVGRPMVVRIPTEAVIPVHIPGNPKEHKGYFVLLDEEGNFVTYKTLAGLFGNYNTGNTFQYTNQITTLLTAKAANNLKGSSSGMQSPMYAQDYSRIYKSIIEADILKRLKNGIYGREMDIKADDSIYLMMLSRVLAGKFTRLLYLPCELVTYFAMDYNEDGTGKSLLENLRMLTSLRAILLFAKVMATAKNSISNTRVNMTIDPEDPDPMKTIEIGINEVMRMRQQTFPFGINSPADLVDWVQRVGVEFGFEGHPGIPNTKFDFESKSIDHKIPDNDLEELLRKQTIMACGLSPEVVDNGFASEFATTVVQNNILLSKRIVQWQNKLIECLDNYISHIIQNDMILRNKFKEIIKTNKGLLEKQLTNSQKQLMDQNEDKFLEYMVDYIGSYISTGLPGPEITTIDTQTAAFDQYSDAIDKALEYWISSQFMSQELVGELNQYIDAIKAALKSHFMRQWMVENGYMTELSDIVSKNEDNKPTIDLNSITQQHIEGVMATVLGLMKKLEAARAAGDTDIKNLQVEGSGSMTPSDTGSSSTGEDEGGAGGEIDLDF